MGTHFYRQSFQIFKFTNTVSVHTFYESKLQPLHQVTGNTHQQKKKEMKEISILIFYIALCVLSHTQQLMSLPFQQLMSLPFQQLMSLPFQQLMSLPFQQLMSLPFQQLMSLPFQQLMSLPFQQLMSCPFHFEHLHYTRRPCVLKI